MTTNTPKPVIAKAAIRINGHVSTFELDEDCLGALSEAMYGRRDLVTPEEFGIVIQGFLSNWVTFDQENPIHSAAFQFGRLRGASTRDKR